jgi:hypothetical protein
METQMQNEHYSTPASSTTKAGRHDIAEILLKVELKHQKINQIKSSSSNLFSVYHTIHCMIIRHF